MLYLIVDVKDSLLYLFIYFLGGVDESLLNVSSRLSRCLHEHQSVLTSERLALFLLYFTTGLQVTECELTHEIICYSVWVFSIMV